MQTRRHLGACSVGLLVAAAARHSLAQTVHQPRDALSLVNPEFRSKLSAPPPGMDKFASASLAERRKLGAAFSRPLLPLPAPQPVEHRIPGPKGAPEVRIYVVGAAPAGAARSARAAVLHMHGGGYILGSAADSLRDAQDLAIALDCCVVTVDYRLAPETRFPGALEDNYAALAWVYHNAAALGVDRTRIALKGESAGGGHAAALAIAARDRGAYPVVMQVLIYPMLDDRTGSTIKPAPSMGAFIWTAAENREGWGDLLGQPAGGETVPAGAVPGRVSNLAGLPTTFIGVGSIDLFFDEDVEYARRLADAGVATELSVVPGGFHGFDAICQDTDLSQQFKAAWIAALKRAFAT